jgi:hypothetical protein
MNGMAFDISAAFGDLKPKDELRKRISEIELHLIDKNPTNFYSIDGIDGLADSIRQFGLMEPLIVKKTDSGRYMLISGHRRRAALRQLADEGFFPEGMHHKVDCLVHEGPVNLPGIEGLEKQEAAARIYEDLLVLAANSDTRVLSSADTAMQVRRYRELYKALKELGYETKGRTRDLVAASAGVSASRIARLDVIDKNLKETRLRKAWQDGTLQETSAYEIARRDPEIQRLASVRVGVDNLCDMKTEDVVVCLDGCEADGNRKRPEPEKASAADTKTVTPLDPAPSRSAEEIAAAYRESSQIEDDIMRDIVRRNLNSILRGIMLYKDHDFSANFRIPTIDAMKRRGNGSYSFGWNGDHEDLQWDSRGVRVRKLMEQDDKRSWVSFNRSWTDFYDALSGAAMELARKKPEPAPEEVSAAGTIPGWSTGEPKAEGRYLCTVDLGNKPAEQKCDWKGGQWMAYGRPVDDVFKVIAWYPLPDGPYYPREHWDEVAEEEEE